MSRKIFGIFLFGIWAVSGCHPHVCRNPTFSLEYTDLSQEVERMASSPLFSLEKEDPVSWWEHFQDPQLSACIAWSLAYHPDMQTAQARIARACQEANRVRAQLLPHFFFTPNILRQKESELSSFGPLPFPWSTQTTLMVTSNTFGLDIWGKKREAWYAALDEVAAAEAERQEVALRLSALVAHTYTQLQTDYARWEKTRQRVAARQALYDLYKQQFDLGIISEFRLYSVSSEIALLQDLACVLEQEIEINRHALSALVENVPSTEGERWAWNLAPAAQVPDPFPLPETLSMDLLRRRPEITARLWDIQARWREIYVARAQFLPEIDLIGYIGVQSIQDSLLFTLPSLFAAGEVLGNLPLFTAGKLQADLGVAYEECELAIAAYNQSVLDAVQEVSDALTAVYTAHARVRALAEDVRDAQKISLLLEDRFLHAITNKLVLLEAQESVYLQEDLYLQAQRARFAAAIDLIQAIGGGYHVAFP